MFTDPGAGLTRDKTRRRGLGKLLDWLEGQPGETWQDRWMASGADDAGFEWTDLPLQGRGTPKSHRRDELATGLVLLVAGQAIRPSYPWLLRQRGTVMLTESRAASDPDAFQRLEQLAHHATPTARSDADICTPQRSKLLVYLKADPKEVGLVPRDGARLPRHW